MTCGGRLGKKGASVHSLFSVSRQVAAATFQRRGSLLSLGSTELREEVGNVECLGLV